MSQHSPGVSKHLYATDIENLLRCGLATLSGGRDNCGGSIISFSNVQSNADSLNISNLKNVLSYFCNITDDDIRRKGFTFVIDMRAATWSQIKPILKCLQEGFPWDINNVIILQPDNFWQKQKTNVGSSKYSFDVSMIQPDQLYRALSRSQLTKEFDGNLAFDQQKWVDLRLEIEEFYWNAAKLMDIFENYKRDMQNNGMPSEKSAVEKTIKEHAKLKNQIDSHCIVAEEVIRKGHVLSSKLVGNWCADNGHNDSGYTSSSHSNSSRVSDHTTNPEFQSDAKRSVKFIEKLHGARQATINVWEKKKVMLDQCLTLRRFEKDAQMLLERISEYRKAFLTSYTEIGNNFESANRVLEHHKAFFDKALSLHKNIDEMLRFSARLIENGHYASHSMKVLSSKLDSEWNALYAGLEDRKTVLSLSVQFHQKSEEYLQRSANWRVRCQISDMPERTRELELLLRQHQSLFEEICQCYTRVCNDGKQLLDALKHAPNPASGISEGSNSPHSQSSITSNVDYTRAATHVVDVLNRVFAQHKELEKLWQERKTRLHQRWALRLFQDDVKEVITWLDHHGEAFLKKNKEIGKSFQRSKTLLKSHDHFESVAQNTYVNTEKLLEAAKHLAQTGECDRNEISCEANKLKEHITIFANRVKRRRKALDLSIAFHSHTNELLPVLNHLRQLFMRDEYPNSVEESLSILEALDRQKDEYLRRSHMVISEAQGLLQYLAEEEQKDSSDFMFLQSGLRKTGSEKENVEKLWSERKQQLETVLNFRVFENEIIECLTKMEAMADDFRGNSQLFQDYDENNLASIVHQVKSECERVSIRGQDLSARLQPLVEINSGSIEEAIVNRIQMLLGLAHEKRNEFATSYDRRKDKLEQVQRLSLVKGDVERLVQMIRKVEQMLDECYCLPTNIIEADSLKTRLEKVQPFVNKASSSLQQIQQQVETILTSGQFDNEPFMGHVSAATTAWQQLYTRSEELRSLSTASHSFHATSEQVCTVLENLENEYCQAEDWLETKDCSESKANVILQKISRHQEQKEAFMKACIHVGRTADAFMKAARRNICLRYEHGYVNESLADADKKIRGMLESVMNLEDRVLQTWSSRKKRLDQCQQYVLFEKSAKQALDWIHDTGDKYLSTHTKLGDTKEEAEALLKEHNEFRENAKETREKVRLLMQLADNLVEKGHIHAVGIKHWVTEVDKHYKDFAHRMEAYRDKLEKQVGMKSEDSHSILSSSSAGDRNSTISLDNKVETRAGPITPMAAEQRKSMKRRECIMAELLQSERAYVTDMEKCINCYLKEMRSTTIPFPLPPALKGKDKIIFCNIEDIFEFHSRTFLRELENYESMPEDVGHCFAMWAPQFDVYIPYCTNKQKSMEVLMASPGSFFDEVQQQYSLDEKLASYLIKPIQRITKYQLLLKDLLSCSDDPRGEIKAGLEVMEQVPEKANNVMHFNLIERAGESLEQFGEVLLRDFMMVRDNAKNKLIRNKKEQDRHVFLCEMGMLLCKSNRETNAATPKYILKSKIMISALIHAEACNDQNDVNKFVIIYSQAGAVDGRLICTCTSDDRRKVWIKKINDIVEESGFTNAFGSLRGKNLRDYNDNAYEDAASMDTVSLASQGSMSEKGDVATVLEEYSNGNQTLRKGQKVEFVDRSDQQPDYSVVRLLPNDDISTAQSSSTANSFARQISATGSDTGYSDLTESCRSTPTSQSIIVPTRILSLPAVSQTNSDSKSEKSESQPALKIGEPKGDTKRHARFFRQSSNTQSPANSNMNRRRIQLKKWLTTPLRKFSQGDLKSETKHDFATHSTASNGDPTDGIKRNDLKINSRQLSYQDDESDLIFSQPAESEKGEEGVNATPSGRSDTGSQGDDDVFNFELPPPMKTLDESCFVDSSTVMGNGDNSIAGQISSLVTGFNEGLSLNEKSASSNLTQLQSLSSVTKSPEIEDFCAIQKSDHMSNDAPDNKPESPDNARDAVAHAKLMREYVLGELIETEKSYVEDMQKIVEGYLPGIKENPPPAELEGKEKIVFANAHQIYEWHRDFFLNQVESCAGNADKLPTIFLKNERRFQMYVIYCQNKPKSELLVQEFDTYFEEIRQKLGHRLKLPDLLIKPVQNYEISITLERLL